MPAVTNVSSGGKVNARVANSSFAHALLAQPDGKLVAVGEATGSSGGLNFALARYNQDGSLDPGFGSGGQVITDARSAAARDLARTQMSYRSQVARDLPPAFLLN